MPLFTGCQVWLHNKIVYNKRMLGTLSGILILLISVKLTKSCKKLNHKNTELRGNVIKWQNQKLKHIKRIDNNYHIPDFVQAFSSVENGRLNLVLKLAKPLTCMTVASNSVILTTHDNCII